jgi:hypothetical protein
MRKDTMNPSVDLRITQLHGEGTVGATWPWIHPHGNLILMEQLNLAAEKGLQEVRARQPSVP